MRFSRRPLDRINSARQFLDDRQRALVMTMRERIRLSRDGIYRLGASLAHRHPPSSTGPEPLPRKRIVPAALAGHRRASRPPRSASVGDRRTPQCGRARAGAAQGIFNNDDQEERRRRAPCRSGQARRSPDDAAGRWHDPERRRGFTPIAPLRMNVPRLRHKPHSAAKLHGARCPCAASVRSCPPGASSGWSERIP